MLSGCNSPLHYTCSLCFMTVYESQSFTKLITIHPIVFERFLRKSKEIIRSVGTCSHSRRFRFISQIRTERKTTCLLVCLCRSDVVQVTQTSSWIETHLWKSDLICTSDLPLWFWIQSAKITAHFVFFSS